MSVDKRSVVNFVIIVVIICAGFCTFMTFGNNYIDETNKITSDIIVTNTTLKSFIHEWGWGGYGYYSIVDTQGKGYTIIGTNNFNDKLYIGLVGICLILVGLWMMWKGMDMLIEIENEKRSRDIK